jgi:predicted nucleotidyltransferase
MEIFALKGIMGIYLYGSWARGEASKHSDYDLLVLVRDLTQVKLGKKLPGVDVRLIGIEDVMRLLKKDPILIVPILREAVPIYGDELLNYLKSLKFSEERLLASLWEALASIELAEGLTKVTRREASSALLYPVMLRFRQYCLTRSIIEGFPGTLKQAEAIAQKCGFEKREFRELYEAFRSEQQGIERKISKRVVLKFLNLVRGLIEECIKKHKPMKIKTERLKRLRELKREFEGILRVAKKETTQRYSLTRRADK